jgi:hypothetical protein
MIKLVDLLKQLLEEDRCKRIADRKYDKPSAYKSGAIVRCRKGNIWKGLKEEEILNEYSDKIINQLVNKFKQEQPSLEPNVIQAYINRFSQIKGGPKIPEKDITKYSWKELENTVDSNQPKRIKAGKINDGEPSSDTNLVYNQNGLRIYAGKTKEACIKYGNGYSFCISSRGEANRYNRYKFESGGTPYFIFDDTKTSEQKNEKFIDPEHLLILFTYISPEEGSEYGEGYSVTKADNSGEDEFSDFDEVERYYPRLKGLENIFQSLKADPKDKAEYDLEKEYQNKIEELGFNYKQKLKDNPYRFHSIYKANKDIDNLLKTVTEPKFQQYFQDIKQLVDEYRNKLSKIKLIKEIIKEVIQEDESLHNWFKRSGAPGKEGGWIDCNTCRDGKCKACGREKGEKRAKYPSCRPTPAQCKTPGKGKKWGKTK